MLWNADNDTIPVRQIFRHWREMTTQNIAKSACNEEQLCRKLHLQKSTSSSTYERFIHQGSQYRQRAVNVWGDVLHMEIHLDSRREHLWIFFFLSSGTSRKSRFQQTQCFLINSSEQDSTLNREICCNHSSE